MKFFLKKVYYLVLFFYYTLKYFNSKFYFFSKIKNSQFSQYVVISSGCEIYNSKISDFTYVSSNSKICNTKIGKFCSIASGVKINLPRHPTKDFISTHPIFYSSSYKKINNILHTKFKEYENVEIGNDVWIGENVLILSGIKIGNGSIIAAGSVVTKDVGDFSIVGGIPAKLIKMRYNPQEIDILNSEKWWDYKLHKILDNFDKLINKELYFDSK